MDPNDISLDNLSKSFEYTKLSGEIDSCSDLEELRNIAKCFCKLYYKQQETMQVMGLANGN
tara:strand:- start:341 stop:523 length:183 start_codon:yes stop_codon:yes gene_type:complete